MLLGAVELLWSLGSEQPPSKLVADENRQIRQTTRVNGISREASAGGQPGWSVQDSPNQPGVFRPRLPPTAKLSAWAQRGVRRSSRLAHPRPRIGQRAACSVVGSRSATGTLLEAGFDFHMVKPADVNLLLSMIANPREARKVSAPV